jgi:plastocyanin
MDKTKELIKNNLTVVYNNEGFTPQEIRIKKGETIKFINLSDRKMWVASNNHPEHNIYPEFDQKDIALREGEYEFKFEKTGAWGYHNHLYSNHEGVVIVE